MKSYLNSGGFIALFIFAFIILIFIVVAKALQLAYLDFPKILVFNRSIN